MMINEKHHYSLLNTKIEFNFFLLNNHNIIYLLFNYLINECSYKINLKYFQYFRIHSQLN